MTLIETTIKKTFDDGTGSQITSHTYDKDEALALTILMNQCHRDKTPEITFMPCVLQPTTAQNLQDLKLSITYLKDNITHTVDPSPVFASVTPTPSSYKFTFTDQWTEILTDYPYFKHLI